MVLEVLNSDKSKDTNEEHSVNNEPISKACNSFKFDKFIETKDEHE